MNNKNIQQLFLHRDQQYQRANKIIFDTLHFALQAISADIKTHQQLQYGKLSFHHIEMVDTVVLFNGIVRYPTGTEFIDAETNELITVEPDTIDSFADTVRVGIPLNVLQNGTTESVIEFLSKVEHRTVSISDSREQSASEGFDTTTLTEEQQRWLEVSNHTDENENVH